MKNTKLIGVKVSLTGKSFYTRVSKPNNEGKYGFGMVTPIIKVDSEAESPEEVKNIVESLLKKNSKNNLETIQVFNSKYPIFTKSKDNENVEGAYIKNDTLINAICTVQYDEKHDRYFLIVDGVKALEELKKYDPFDNNIKFE